MGPALKVKNLTKKFARFTAIDGVSFEAGEGEIFGLLGPNGAGKTTTLRVVATLLKPTSGTAEVLGFDIIKEPEKVRRNIGLLTTEMGVYDRFTGRENLRYFGELYGLRGEFLENRIEEVGALLDMDEFIDRRAGKYSTGMKQKLAIARAIVHNPQIIIFDEPTSGLDVLASQTVRQFMRKSKALGKCIVLSTHQMLDAQRLCDRVAIIHRGKIVAAGRVADLMAQTQTSNLEDTFLKLVDVNSA